MWTNVIALMAACLSVTVATAQTDEDTKWARGEIAGEMQVCGDYFGVVSRCLKSQRPDLAATYQVASDRIMLSAIPGLQAAGVSDKAIVAQSLAYTELMMKAMNGNCSNIQVLLNRYMNFCLQLDHDSTPRLKEWIACVHARQQSCGGPGLP
jgi:hypothetical protein